VAMVLLIATASASAATVEYDDNQADERVDDGPRIVRRAILEDQEFDQFIFGRPESVEEVRSRMYQTVRGQVRQLDRKYHLTAAQKEKLLLAGLGDIKHGIDRVEELRKKWQLAKYERRSAVDCMRAAQSLHGELESATASVDSLFCKTLATTITEDQ